MCSHKSKKYACSGNEKIGCNDEPCILILPYGVSEPDPQCIWEHLRKSDNPQVTWVEEES